MKDIHINFTKKQQKTELLIFSLSLVISIFCNIYSIIWYHTKWSELFTQMHVVVAIGIVLYLLILLIRLIYFVIKMIWQ